MVKLLRTGKTRGFRDCYAFLLIDWGDLFSVDSYLKTFIAITLKKVIKTAYIE